MKIRILGLTRNIIPYVRDLQPIAQTVAGCVLMQQLDYWFERKPDGFYKFLEPPEKNHDFYRPGDSWCEELGISKDEFRTAFDRFGIRYKSKSEHDEAFATDRFQKKYYCSYLDRRSNLTWYFRNHELLDAKLLEMFAPGCSIQSMGNEDSRCPVNREPQFTGSGQHRSTINKEFSPGGKAVIDFPEVGKTHLPITETTHILPKNTHRDGVPVGEKNEKSCDTMYYDGSLIASRKDFKDRIQARVVNEKITEDQAWESIQMELIGLIERENAKKSFGRGAARGR